MELLCKCGHRDTMHSSFEDALKFYNHKGRMCIEYRDYPNYDAPYLHATEEICVPVIPRVS